MLTRALILAAAAAAGLAACGRAPAFPESGPSGATGRCLLAIDAPELGGDTIERLDLAVKGSEAGYGYEFDSSSSPILAIDLEAGRVTRVAVDDTEGRPPREQLVMDRWYGVSLGKPDKPVAAEIRVIREAVEVRVGGAAKRADCAWKR